MACKMGIKKYNLDIEIKSAQNSTKQKQENMISSTQLLKHPQKDTTRDDDDDDTLDRFFMQASSSHEKERLLLLSHRLQALDGRSVRLVRSLLQRTHHRYISASEPNATVPGNNELLINLMEDSIDAAESMPMDIAADESPRSTSLLRSILLFLRDHVGPVLEFKVFDAALTVIILFLCSRSPWIRQMLDWIVNPDGSGGGSSSS